MKILKRTIILIVVFQFNYLIGQEFYMYSKAKPLFNPAFVGTQNLHEVNVIRKSKIYKQDYFRNNYDSYFVDYETYVPKLKSGIGIFIYNSETLFEKAYDLDEKTNLQNIGLTYNFQSNIGKKWAFSLGTRVDRSITNGYVDITDCNLQYYICPSKYPSHKPLFKRKSYEKSFNVALGGVIYTRKFNFSLAFNELTYPVKLRQFYGNMGYNIFFRKKDDHKLSFNLSAKSEGVNTLISLYTQYTLKFISVGASYNENIPGTYSLKAGLNTKIFNLSYCYTHKTKELMTFFYTPYRYSLTHELALTLKIPNNNKRQSKPLNLLMF